MTKNKAKNKGIGTVLDYLDNEIEKFYQKNGNYPKKIIISKDTKDKVFAELELEPIMDNCWKTEKGLNYRGIKFEIKKSIFLELK